MTTRSKKSGKSQKNDKLKEFYADDMMDEEAVQDNRQRPRNALIEEDEDDELENVNLEAELSKQKDKKINMDRISDILVNMIFKNKVNSKNAFEVPFPNVEDLSDFRQASGDTSWKKLSQTLDAGAKIYGFRVDSVHNETYKVLGGLNRADIKEIDEAIQEELRKDEEEGVGRRPKRDTEGESTLEKNIANIDANKYDLEFDVDPLFQKTSAKFDEGGAKGLLLNNLFVNPDLNLMLDSHGTKELQSLDSQVIGGKLRISLTKSDLKDLPSGDIWNMKLCPELTTFKQNYLKDAKDFIHEITYLEKSPTPKKNQNKLVFENVDVDADQILTDLGQITEGEYNDPQFITDFQFHEEASITGKYSQASQLASQKKEPQKTQELDFSTIEEKLANLGFGQSLNKLLPEQGAWMGPEAWKIKLKKEKTEKKPKKERKKSTKKEEISVEFDMSTKENWKEVFGIVGTRKKTPSSKIDEEEPIGPEVKQSYLLPIDMHIRPRRLANLFMRGFDTKGRAGKESVYSNKMGDELLEIQFNIGELPEQEEEGHDEIAQNLESIFGKGETQADKTDRSINIKVLKEKMWGYIADRVQEVDADEESSVMGGGKKNKPAKKPKRGKKGEDDTVMFSEVCAEIPSVVGGAAKGISIHSNFVTVLHLANEKGLRFVKEGEDFKIYKEVTA